MTPEQQAAKIVRLADHASRAFERSLAKVYREAERKLARLLKGVTDTDIIRASQAAQWRLALRDTLNSAGYDELVHSATGASLDRIAAQVLKGTLAAEAGSLVGDFKTQIEALKTLHAMDLLDEGDAVSKDIWRAVMRGIMAKADPGRLIDELASVLDHSQSQIGTLYDTSVSIFGRQVEILHAGNDEETRFLYSGPDDEIVRPFCKQHLGKVYTRAEIDEMDNGQLGTVILTGGGYNCRHVWLEVSKFSEADIPEAA